MPESLIPTPLTKAENGTALDQFSDSGILVGLK
jgi:hypothetical protein